MKFFSKIKTFIFSPLQRTAPDFTPLTENRGGGGGAVTQSVERTTPGEEIPGLIPAVAARSLLVGSASV